ncbi:hypothetical protein JHK85_010362 [Glycine max]|nr:hypothetical protein JHK85_010362 [Glycine max]
MNVRFSGSAMKLTGEIEEEIVNVSIDDVVLQLKNGKDEEFAVALLRLKEFMRSERLDGGLIDEEATLSILFNRLGSCKADNRLTIIRLLRSIALGNDEKKEKMVEIEFLSAVVKSLTRDSEERKEAVGLLLDLSDIQAVRRRIGRIQGCIVMLVAILNGDDPDASHDAAKLLDILSSNTQNALHMAEAGYFRPLVQYLKEGSDMNKILMAKALSRLELTDHSKLSLGEAGAIEPLANMFSTGSGIAGTLLQLLFSVTSVLMTLREPASAILARIAQSESILVNDDVAQQMLSLLNFSSPIIQGHLLEALNNIASHPGASKVRSKMKEKGALQLLLPFLKENTTKVRSKVLQLLYSLSKDLTDELTEHLNETHLFNIVNIISTSTLESERAAAVGILSNLPNSNKKVTDIPKRANLLPILISIMYSSTGSDSSTTNNFLNESIASVIIRFTIFSDKKLQLLSAEQGVILLLVKLLSSGSPITKSRAAISLVQLSQNSLSLRKSRKSRWPCAVSPLIQLLEDTEREVVEAALHALSTLLLDEIWEGGVNSIAKLSGVEAIIKNVQVEDAKVILIDLAQKSDSRLKSTVAKVLAELELLQSQSKGTITITPKKSIQGTKSLVSAAGTFEAGFFNFGNSQGQYFGIWYKNISPRTIVWVANRDAPVKNSTAFLTLTHQGNPVILDGSKGIVWFSNSSRIAEKPIMQLLDSGNLVVKD